MHLVVLKKNCPKNIKKLYNQMRQTNPNILIKHRANSSVLTHCSRTCMEPMSLIDTWMPQSAARLGHRLNTTKGSPLPFPLGKGWACAWYHPLFRGEFMQKKWSRFCSKRARALHLVAAFYLDALGHVGNPIARFCQSCWVTLTYGVGPQAIFWLFTHDHFVVRWTTKKSTKINVETLRWKNGTDLISKPTIELEVVR